MAETTELERKPQEIEHRAYVEVRRKDGYLIGETVQLSLSFVRDVAITSFDSGWPVDDVESFLCTMIRGSAPPARS